MTSEKALIFTIKTVKFYKYLPKETHSPGLCNSWHSGRVYVYVIQEPKFTKTGAGEIVYFVRFTDKFMPLRIEPELR